MTLTSEGRCERVSTLAPKGRFEVTVPPAGDLGNRIISDQGPNTERLRERLTRLFEFLKAYTELRFPPLRDIAQQPYWFWLKDLPRHPSVELFRDVGRSEEEIEEGDIVLRLARP